MYTKAAISTSLHSAKKIGSFPAKQGHSVPKTRWAGHQNNIHVGVCGGFLPQAAPISLQIQSTLVRTRPQNLLFPPKRRPFSTFILHPSALPFCRPSSLLPHPSKMWRGFAQHFDSAQKPTLVFRNGARHFLGKAIWRCTAETIAETRAALTLHQRKRKEAEDIRCSCIM
jgi:hypothetical protein